jgi:hypothetical protein
MRRIWIAHGFIIGLLVSITLMALLAGRAFGGDSRQWDAAIDCQLPCWQDIRPGETRVNEASNTLRNLGYRPRRLNEDAGIATNIVFIHDDAEGICQVGLTPGFGGLIREIILRACEPMPVGEVLNLIGSPDSMLPIASLVIFQEGQTILTLRQPLCTSHKVYPDATIRFISLADSTMNMMVANQQSDLPWQGFLPFWRYGQLHPDKPVC